MNQLKSNYNSPFKDSYAHPFILLVMNLLEIDHQLILFSAVILDVSDSAMCLCRQDQVHTCHYHFISLMISYLMM